MVLDDPRSRVGFLKGGYYKLAQKTAGTRPVDRAEFTREELNRRMLREIGQRRGIGMGSRKQIVGRWERSSGMSSVREEKANNGKIPLKC